MLRSEEDTEHEPRVRYAKRLDTFSPRYICCESDLAALEAYLASGCGMPDKLDFADYRHLTAICRALDHLAPRVVELIAMLRSGDDEVARLEPLVCTEEAMEGKMEEAVKKAGLALEQELRTLVTELKEREDRGDDEAYRLEHAEFEINDMLSRYGVAE